MAKRALKKSKKAKKPAKKKTARKTKKAKKTKKTAKPKAKAPKVKVQKPIGVVTHYYTEISVAIVKFNRPVAAGSKLHYRGATTDFAEHAKSMQFNHENVKKAPKGKQVGIKVKKRVREGDAVHFAE
ncbi:MAG TPA: hypothetical protein VMU07_00805 [Candidatus Paceibacterota bacterium]|nr:hypothetical protein [Candidatus Paceibacterota bacterium]